MIVIYKKGHDIVMPDALSRLSIKLYSQKKPEEEKQAFAGMILFGLDETELKRLRKAYPSVMSTK